MENQKGNLYLIIAIIVGVFAIGAVVFASWKYFGGDSELKKNGNEITKPIIEKETEKSEIVSETVDETANWKIYQNKEYGYEVKYPENWFLEEKRDLVSFYNQNPKIYKFKRTREISPGVFDYPKENFIFQISVINNAILKSNLVQKKPITISKTDGIHGILIGGEGEKILMAHLIRNNKTFDFYGRPADSTFVNLFNQMIFTFKFTD